MPQFLPGNVKIAQGNFKMAPDDVKPQILILSKRGCKILFCGCGCFSEFYDNFCVGFYDFQMFTV